MKFRDILMKDFLKKKEMCIWNIRKELINQCSKEGLILAKMGTAMSVSTKWSLETVLKAH